MKRAVLCLIMFALVTAQALGLMHRIVHLPHSPGAVAGVHAEHAGGHWSAKLFFGHSGHSDCRLFDPLSPDGGAPCVPAVILPVVLSTFFFDFFQGEALVRWATLYDARGPPLLG